MDQNRPSNVIPLFPEKIKVKPAEHPAVKTFLHDAAVSTKPAKLSISESGMSIEIAWNLSENRFVSAIINVNTNSVLVDGFDMVGYNFLHAHVPIEGESNRWLGYLIDDRS